MSVSSLAAAKRLPADFLAGLGVRDLPGNGVGIPYHDFNGDELAVKRRTAMAAKDGSYWPKGKSLTTYGSWRIEDARKVGYFVLVEGESDCWALWHAKFPALGLPGSGTAKTLQAEHLVGIDTVYVVREPDRGGESFVKGVVDRLKELGFEGSVRVVDMADVGYDDTAAMWLVNTGTFRQRFQACLEGAGEASEAEGVGNPVIEIIIPAPRELGSDAYHGPAGDFMRAVAPHTEATDAGVLAHFLPAAGVLVGPGPFLWAGGKQYPRLNVGVVGKTSRGRKGTSFAPVDLFMSRAVPDFWRVQKAGGLSSGEGLIAFLSDKVGEDDDGNEVVVPVEKRLYAIEPEFSRVLANARREGNVLSQVLRETYDSGDLGTLTVTPRRVSGAHVCVVGHITPDELAARLHGLDVVNGFANRFAWFHVESNKIMPHTRPIPDDVFRPFLPLARRLLEFGPDERPVEMDAAAAGLWKDVYPELIEDGPGLAGAVTARGAPMVVRLSLIYALLDNPRPAGLSVREEHVRAALAVWDYCRQSAEHLFGTGGSGNRLQDKLLSLLADGPKTRTEFNKHLSPGQKGGADAALAALEAAGRVRKTVKKHEGPGRPAIRWERVEPPNKFKGTWKAFD